MIAYHTNQAAANSSSAYLLYQAPVLRRQQAYHQHQSQVLETTNQLISLIHFRHSGGQEYQERLLSRRPLQSGNEDIPRLRPLRQFATATFTAYGYITHTSERLFQEHSRI
jgi:hypothetical protein